LNGFKSNKHAADEDRHIGYRSAKFDKSDTKLSLFRRQARKASGHWTNDERLNIKMRRAHRHIHVPYRRLVRQNDMDINTKAIGMQSKRVRNTANTIQRV
jgi:hypothetical protein